MGDDGDRGEGTTGHSTPCAGILALVGWILFVEAKVRQRFSIAQNA
jgi:hypothetical protein